MKSIHAQLFLICFALLFSTCKKEAGPGGTASIRGKVYAQYYDKYFYTMTAESYAPDVDVYIIYGNATTYGNHQKTSFDGSYDFKYLRNGSYKIYTYSRDSTGFSKNQVNKYVPAVVALKNVDITKRNQIMDLPDINIFQ